MRDTMQPVQLRASIILDAVRDGTDVPASVIDWALETLGDLE